ncbi:hypothetical protein RHOSPDRAFT_19585 [Rhodotorula sp. JG-1b]|nr:hypothetical protein RHOSPDRAFT_19585 [Rhodotorula sp. JG-1b]
MASCSTDRRYAHSRALLGTDLFNKVANAKLLVVHPDGPPCRSRSAGGIGCELIKNLVMSGFGTGARGEILVLDLDTIDLSNLNRQFLFQKQHVKRPKAVVARETALKFNPNVNMTALHRNIKDDEFNVDFFKRFDFVINALDNLDARRHVNKMCLAANIPLLESGTTGYTGQAQPIKRDLVECFDCTGKAVPKTFAVCTIRSTPSTAHHCIAWAKSYLFPQLYGADDEADQQELDDAEKNGENVDEIKELRKEANANRELRATLNAKGAAERIFRKVYHDDIARLLKMEDMWAHRKPPHTLDWGELSSSAAGAGDDANKEVPSQTNGVAAATTEKDQARIKDQRKLSLKDSFDLFVDAVDRLTKRFDPNGEALSFDKDDEDTLDFVVGAANLRAAAFDIEGQTKFQVKEYAGNIIPAIATTNAIIAAALVHQALNVLRGSWDSARSIWLLRNSERVFDVSPLYPPNPHCAVCRAVYVPVRVVEDVTLGELVKTLVGGEDEGKPIPFAGIISVQEGSRMLFESEDFEDNADKTLTELGIGVGKFVTISEDDEPHWPVQLCLGRYVSPTCLSSHSAPGLKFPPNLAPPAVTCPLLPASGSSSMRAPSPLQSRCALLLPSPKPTRTPKKTSRRWFKAPRRSIRKQEGRGPKLQARSARPTRPVCLNPRGLLRVKRTTTRRRRKRSTISSSRTMTRKS